MLIRDCRVEGYKDSRQLHRSSNRLYKQVSAGASKFYLPLLKIEAKVSQNRSALEDVKCGRKTPRMHELEGVTETRPSVCDMVTATKMCRYYLVSVFSNLQHDIRNKITQ